MLQPGALINQRYQIVRQVGQGGFGFVYEARDIRLAKTVALKQTRFTDAQRKQAFEREAQLLAQLKHTGLPPVTDHFSDTDGQFLVMEFIPGDDLATKLQQRGGPFPLAQVLQWADQLLEILAYLHNYQPPVCHYDIKPGNLKLAPDGSLMLLDFGLAKSSDSRASGFSDDYSPHEQFAGTGTDARSDLYAAGATLYHLLVGTPPPNAPTRSIAVHQNGKPDPLRPPHVANSAIPSAVSAALVYALAIRPDDRPASATVLRALLAPSLAEALAGLAPTQAIPPPQGSAPRQAPLHPPVAVGTPTIAVRPPPATPKAPSFLLWLGTLLVVVLVGAFLLGGLLTNRSAPPPTSAPVATTVAGVVPPTTVPSTVAPTAVPSTIAPTAVSPTVAPTAVSPTVAPTAVPP
ncbi:MAG: protein kinase, partial [Chloroflexales bacterium]